MKSMQKISMRSLVLAIAFLFAMTFVPAAAFAEDGSGGSNSGSGSSGRGDDDTTVTTTQATEDENETEDTTEDNSISLKDQLQELQSQHKQHRLEQNKLRVCELRKTKISAIMTRSITRAEKQLALFTTISERVKTFYAEKGHTLSNYNDLVAAVDAAKTKAQADLDTLKNTTPFDCNSEDPKGQVEEFKLGIKTINQDLKDYRTAVKNLIVGVKSVQSTEAKDEGGTE
jgi:hypothetical protein